MIRKVLQLRDSLADHGISHVLFQNFDIKSLGDGYYRAKFPPMRIIFFVENDTVYLDKIFKESERMTINFIETNEQ
jgi:hypothetical protein